MDEYHDENTLQKVHDGLRRAGLRRGIAEDAINCMMNEGILFRERKKEKFADCETLEELIFQAIGAASVCWDNQAPLGQFDSTQAKDIGDEVVERIRQMYEYDKQDGGPREGGTKQNPNEEAHDMDNKSCTCTPVTVAFTATCKDLEESERVLEYFSRAAAQMANDQIPVSINLYNFGDSVGPLP